MLYNVYYKRNTYHLHGEENDKAVYRRIYDIIDKTEIFLHTVKINDYEVDVYVTSQFGRDNRQWDKNEELVRNYRNCAQYAIKQLYKQANYSWEELKAMKAELIEVENELFYHNMAERWTDEERKQVNYLEYRRSVLREIL